MRERLYRSEKDKLVAGVCGGLAEYFEVDPVIIRIAFVAGAMLSGGMGIIVYILLWIIVPSKEQVAAAAAPGFSTGTAEGTPAAENAAPRAETAAPGYRRNRTGRNIFGYILIGLGLLIFAERFLPYWEVHNFWPLVLIAIGIGLLLKSSKK